MDIQMQTVQTFRCKSRYQLSGRVQGVLQTNRGQQSLQRLLRCVMHTRHLSSSCSQQSLYASPTMSRLFYDPVAGSVSSDVWSSLATSSHQPAAVPPVCPAHASGLHAQLVLWNANKSSPLCTGHWTSADLTLDVKVCGKLIPVD